MADHLPLETETDPNKVSPKVLWPLLVGIALTALAAALSALTPEVLAALGPYALPVSLGAAAAAQYITGYFKKDPARTGIPLEPMG